jgi:hypothetical protein
MLEIIKLNFRYLLSKSTILILILVFCFIAIGVISSSGVLENYYYLDMFRSDQYIQYVYEVSLILKITIIIESILLTIMINTESYNNLCKYIVDKPQRKYAVFIAKLIVIVFVALFIQLIDWLFVFSFTKIILPFDIINEDLFLVIKITIAQSIIYIMITNIIMSILPNIFVGILPIGLFWYLELNSQIITIEENELLKMLYQWIPNTLYIDNHFINYANMQYVLLFCIIAIFGNCLIFVKKDIY